MTIKRAREVLREIVVDQRVTEQQLRAIHTAQIVLRGVAAFHEEIKEWSDLNHQMYAEEVEPGVSDNSVLEAERDAIDNVLTILYKHLP